MVWLISLLVKTMFRLSILNTVLR